MGTWSIWTSLIEDEEKPKYKVNLLILIEFLVEIFLN